MHHVLGRHRPDDPRQGWIGGRAEGEGERHPTRGGLRIGKPLPERPAGDPYDARLEWDRDGQYFHYLTQWLHALHRVGLHALERMLALPARPEGVRAGPSDLTRHLPLARRIDAFWCVASSRQGATWRAHRDINAVMLATSLAPGGYLGSA